MSAPTGDLSYPPALISVEAASLRLDDAVAGGDHILQVLGSEALEMTLLGVCSDVHEDGKFQA